MRMDIVCSSIMYEAVISRAREDVLTVKGVSGSDAMFESDQSATA
jgi:hypothetical protein